MCRATCAFVPSIVYTRKGEFGYFHQGGLVIYGRHQRQMVKYLASEVPLEYKEHAVGQKVPAGEGGPGRCRRP